MKAFISGQAMNTAGMKQMVKRASVVYMERQEEAFEVDTDRGRLFGVAGDYIAYDPATLNCWPVSPGYLDQHYAELESPPAKAAPRKKK